MAPMSELRTRVIMVRILLDKALATGENVKEFRSTSGQDGLTISVGVNQTIGFMNHTADVTIYGMSASDINEFSFFNNQAAPMLVFKNKIQIFAGYADQSNGLPLLYEGGITLGAVDYNDVNRPFRITSMMGYDKKLELAPHTNTKGNIDAAQVFKNLAAGMGLTLQNNAVAGTLNNHILSGSYPEQIQQLADHLNVQAVIDNNELLIAKKYAPLRNGIINITADDNLLGYPTIDNNGISIRARFSPFIEFGRAIQVTSVTPQANGNWIAVALNHTLETRHARWETEIKGNKYGFLGGA
jgi:hypothetical protein